MKHYITNIHWRFVTDSKTKSKSVPNKPIDLEKWLDSVLDD